MFFTKKELSTEKGCVLWGTRVIVPSKMRKLVKTKSVLWPNLDSDAAQMCKEWVTGQLEHKRQSNMVWWMLTQSGWKEFWTSQITSPATVTKLRRLFASYGLPEQTVTDNVTTFTSEEFQTFAKQNAILHTSAPGHLATNGWAEREVHTCQLYHDH